MLKHLQHKRFTAMSAGKQMLNDKLSSLRCYWYAQVTGIIIPKGNENDSKNKRPDCVHT
jgi:hypothetical protein